MGEAKRNQTEAACPQPKSLVARVTSRLASVKFAVAVVIIIAVACVVGTLLPQGADVVKYLKQNPEAAGRMRLLEFLGLTHVFYSWWFIGLLCTLSASVATCSTRRFSTVRRTTGSTQRRALGSMLTHISILLILAGGVVRGVWGEKGYLEFREGQTVAQFVGNDGLQPLPFKLHLEKFEIETYAPGEAGAPPLPAQPAAAAGDKHNMLVVTWADKDVIRTVPVKLDVEQVVTADEESFRLKVLRYVPDFLIDTATREVKSRSLEPRNPAILVAVTGASYANHQWLFARFPDFSMPTEKSAVQKPSPLKLQYISRGGVPVGAGRGPDGPIKSFRSTVKVVEGEAVTREQQLEVNRPMRYGGYRFYQSGYNPRDLTYTSFQVVKDPGVPVVYAGFGLMIVGLFIVFYLNPWMTRREAKR